MATDWFGGGLRLALLGYGLPPLLLAAAALWLSRQRTVPQVPWGWLALFGAVHGTSQWFGEFPRGVAVVSWAEHARWCLVAASFGILYEFGRRGARGQGGWAPPPWATIVLGTLASCGLAAGTAGLNAASRYTFGLAGGLLAASTLWRAAWARDARCCPALSLAAVAMLLFGLNSAAFAPRSALWPASWLNYEALQGSVGPAIHVSRGACVLICAACLWTVARPWHRPAGVRWSLWWPLPVTIVAVTVAGRVAVNWHGEALDRQMRATLMAQVVGIADALDPEAVSRLTFTAADSQSVTFRQIRWQLRAFAQYARLRSVYTLAVRSGHMCFGPESMDEDDPWASPPGTPYSPPTDDLPRVFESGTPTVAGPVTDEYGSFVSGLAPVLDPRTGDVLAVVGVDIETDAWSARVAARRLAAMVPAIGVAAILLGGWAVLLWRDLLSPSWQRRLRQTETVMVAGLGGLLTAALWQGATYTEALRTRASLAHLCDVQVRALRQSLRETLDELDSLTRFIEGSEVVTAQEFEVFVRPLRRSSPGEAWAWIPLVQDSGRARLEALLRETGRAAFRVCDAVPDGRLVPAGQRAQYAPIAHVAPTLSGAPPLGYDVLRDPVWSSAVLHAAATGEPSAAVRPATESEGAAIMLARSVAAGPTGRPGGVAACFMNLQPEIARVLQRDRLASSQTTLHLVDLSGEGRPAVLAWWPPQRAPDGAAAGPVDPLTAYPVAAYPLLPAGRAWAVLLAPSPAFISAHRGWAGILALLGGSVLTVVITAFAASVRDRQVRLEHDVRERTRELREYAEHHRIVADFSYDWEMWLGPDAEVRYISQSCERITGYPPSAFVEDPGLLGRVVHPDDRLLVERHIAESTTGRTGACELRFRIVTPDDEIRWISHVCQPVHAADGQFLGSRSSNRDITAHYQAEEALRAAHRRMALHMEQTPLAVVECDPGGRVVEWNPAAESMFGYTRDEALGRHAAFIVPPEARSSARDAWRTLLATRGIHRSTNANRRKDGTVIWCEWYDTPLVDESGAVIGVASLAQDITARLEAEEALRESEERYRQIIGAMTDALAILDPDGRQVLLANPAYCELHGYNHEELLALDPQELVDPEHREAVAQATGAVSSESPVSEVVHVRSDGSRIPVDLRRTRVRFGGRDCILEVLRDATARRRAEEERLEIERQLQQAQKLESLGVLAGGVAHDFNNVLAVITGFTELAATDAARRGQSHEALDQVLRAADRAKDLVQQILTFARRAPSERQPLSLEPVVKEALRFLRSTLPATIQFRQSIGTSCPPVVADPTQVHQVIMNLCTNAQHAMREEGGVLSVSLRSQQIGPQEAARLGGIAEGVYAVLSVSDTGCGMDEAVRQRIFEPFFTTKRQGEGTGLGLSVTHGIVTAHGGTIAVASEPGRGSTFDVYLPCVEGPHEEAPSVTPPPACGTERVLLVDDEPLLAQLAEQMLSSLGYSVTAYSESRAALEAFLATPDRFDIVVTDQTMPLLTGTELAARVKDVRPGMAVLLVTGLGHEMASGSRGAASIDGLLMKPYTMHALAEAVRQALDGRRNASL